MARKKNPDDQKSVRVLRLVQIFTTTSPRRWRVEELAEELQVGKRTAYRDLKDAEFFLPLSEENHHYWVDSRQAALARLPLTETELRSLTLTTQSSHDPALRLVLRRIIDKLSSAADQSVLAQLDSLKRHLPAPTEGHAPNSWELLTKAATDGLRLEMTYHSLNRTEPVPRKVDPYTLFPTRGVWYFSAFDHLSNTIRTFRIGRILTLTETGERFIPAPERGATDYLSADSEPVAVSLKVCPLTARLLHETPIHPSQQIAGDSVSLKVGQPNLLIPCLLSLPDVEVLEPATLRQALADKAQAIAQRHQKS